MAKPILLSVDDDSDVLRAIERDLRSKYGAGYRVIGSDSPEGALDLLKQLKVRNDSVALLLADQRMPRMDGVEFLQEAKEIFPGAKRALLTAYADTQTAIAGINTVFSAVYYLKVLKVMILERPADDAAGRALEPLPVPAWSCVYALVPALMILAVANRETSVFIPMLIVARYGLRLFTDARLRRPLTTAGQSK